MQMVVPACCGIVTAGPFPYSAYGAPVAASAATAQENWNANCRTCHGPDGSAKTPMGQRLKLKDYTAAAVQAELKDDEMFREIKEGVKDSTGKQVMPAYAAKLSDDDIRALLVLVRSFKKE